MRSDLVKKGFERAPHRSLLRAVGLRDEDFEKPFIGIANSQVDIIPGHVPLGEYGRIAKEEIRRAGGRWATTACSTACRVARSSPTPSRR